MTEDMTKGWTTCILPKKKRGILITILASTSFIYLTMTLGLFSFRVRETDIKTPSMKEQLYVIPKSASKTTKHIIKPTTSAPHKGIHILVNAYMRSGSTFATSFLTGQPSTFFVYEPLWEITPWGYFNSDGEECKVLTPLCRPGQAGFQVDIEIYDDKFSQSGDRILSSHITNCNISEIKHIRSGFDKNQELHNSNSSRDGALDFLMRTQGHTLFGRILPLRVPAETPLETSHRFLRDVYRCNFNDNTSDVINHITDSLSGSLWNAFKSCKKKKGKPACMPELVKPCTKSKIRVTKVLRLSLDTTKPLLITDPSLKVVQLFRDPRSIICSRLVKTGWYPLKVVNGSHEKVTENARSLCNKMLNDYKAGVQLIKEFPTRVRFIRYEDFVSNHSIKAAEDLHKFVNFEGKPRSRKSTDTSFDWRRLLSKRVIDIVDSECAAVYDVLGYSRLTTAQIRDKKYSSYNSDMNNLFNATRSIS